MTAFDRLASSRSRSAQGQRPGRRHTRLHDAQTVDDESRVGMSWVLGPALWVRLREGIAETGTALATASRNETGSESRCCNHSPGRAIMRRGRPSTREEIAQRIGVSKAACPDSPAAKTRATCGFRNSIASVSFNSRRERRPNGATTLPRRLRVLA